MVHNGNLLLKKYTKDTSFLLLLSSYRKQKEFWSTRASYCLCDSSFLCINMDMNRKSRTGINHIALSANATKQCFMRNCSILSVLQHKNEILFHKNEHLFSRQGHKHMHRQNYKGQQMTKALRLVIIQTHLFKFLNQNQILTNQLKINLKFFFKKKELFKFNHSTK